MIIWYSPSLSTAEETAPHYPASIVVGGAADQVTDQMVFGNPSVVLAGGGATEPSSSQILVVNPTVVPVETFSHLQGNLVGLSSEVLTDQASALPIPSVAPFRRAPDTPTTGDVPLINHIGVFVKGDSTDDAYTKHQNRKPEYVSDQYDPDSPVVPMPEWSLERRQALVGGGREGVPLGCVAQDPGVSYSQECTEASVFLLNAENVDPCQQIICSTYPITL